jgi:hypothetical protein
MSEPIEDQLRKEGLVRADPFMGEFVPVQIGYHGALPKVDRMTRKILVVEKLADALFLIEQSGGKGETETLSVSGQCMEAMVPISHYNEIAMEIKKNPELTVQPIRMVDATMKHESS